MNIVSSALFPSSLPPPPPHTHTHSDIQATVNSIQIGSAAAPGDGRGVVNCEGVVDSPRESIDYQAEYEATESEVEAILQDSIDVFYSFSDTEEN